MGNTARSPAAEYLAKYYAQKYGLNLHIESAGFFNAFTYMQPQSSSYLYQKQIDHSNFRPQTINRALLERFDLIITMEKSHKRDIINSYGDIKGIKDKLYTLKEFNGAQNTDIIDPYYASSQTYSKILEIIDENVENLILKIYDMND